MSKYAEREHNKNTKRHEHEYEYGLDDNPILAVEI